MLVVRVWMELKKESCFYKRNKLEGVLILESQVRDYVEETRCIFEMLNPDFAKLEIRQLQI